MSISIESHATTMAAMTGPLGPGVTYTDSSTPVIVKAAQGGQPNTIVYMPPGSPARGSQFGPYTYEHGFICIGPPEDGPRQFHSCLNDAGLTWNTQNAGGTGGPDDREVREHAAALGSDFEEMAELIAPEAIPNTVLQTGPSRNGGMRTAYIRSNGINELGPDDPFYLVGFKEIGFWSEVNNMDNWSRGDPNLFEVRDLAHIWHMHNPTSIWGSMTVPNHRLIWITAGPSNYGPFIPFSIDDPYIHEAFKDSSYESSIISNPYTHEEIAEIEDLIMAPDGAVMGDIREIQRRIVERLPIIPGAVLLTSSSLPDGNVLENYSASLSAYGGAKPYSWHLVDGALPPGLLLADGVISGLPIDDGLYPFTIEVMDANGNSARRELSIKLSDPESTLLEARFDSGNDGFVYQDDSFRGTSQPVYAAGVWQPAGGTSGGALEVILGGMDNATIQDMSGGWQRSFSLDVPTELILSFRYKLSQSPFYAGNELVQLMLNLDGELVGLGSDDFLTQQQAGDNAQTDQWHSVEINLGNLAVGEHSLIVGAYSDRKSDLNQTSTLRFDDLMLVYANRRPQAQISASRTLGAIPMDVGFSSSGSIDTDGTIESYLWNFGDGNSSSDADPLHIFETPGLYSATLTVTDDQGATDSATLTIEVAEEEDVDPPSEPANLSATPIKSDRIQLSWDASTDNTGVAGYRIFRDAIEIADIQETSYLDQALSPATLYDYWVISYDAWGNESTEAMLAVTTGDAPTLATLSLTPTTLLVEVGGTRQFDAQGTDQYGDPITETYSWSLTGGGTLNQSGYFYAETVGEFTLTAASGGVSASAALTIIPFNDPPVARNSSVTTDEDQPVSASLDVEDVDNEQLNYHLLTAPSMGTLELNPSTGAFIYTPALNEHGSDSFTFKADDGEKESGIATVSLTITSVNDAPQIVQGEQLNMAASEDTPASLNLSATDVDGDVLSWSIQTPPEQGSASVDADGLVSYTPVADASGTAQFVVEVSDGSLSDRITIDVTITAVNDAPTVSGASLTTDEDQPASGTLSGADIDSEALSYRISRQPTLGSVTLVAETGVFTYTPTADAHGSDSFAFVVSDGEVESEPAEIAITISPVNDAPQIVQGEQLNMAASEDTPASLNLSATDVDGDALSWSLPTPPEQGSASVDADGLVSYTPAADASGTAQFVVEVSDGSLSDRITIDVTITAVNDAPTVSGASLTTDEDQPASGTLSGADIDSEALSYRISRQPTLGSVTLVAETGAFTYTPTADAHGSDSFAFVVSDGEVESEPAEIAITINPVNDAPQITLGEQTTIATAEDTPLSLALSASDVDGDTLSWSIQTPPGQGSATIDASGLVRYTPNPDVNGTDELQVRVIDPNGAVDSITIRILIGIENDTPRATSASLTTDEDRPLVGTLIASDPDGDPLRFIILTPPSTGSLALDEQSGAFTFTPSPNLHASDSFSFKVNDGMLDSSPAIVRIDIRSINDRPTVSGTRLNLVEDGVASGRLQASDADGDRLLYTLVAEPAKGALSLDGATGEFSYTPAAHANGDDSFSFKVSDGQFDSEIAQVEIHINSINDAPLASAASLEIDEDGAIQGTLVASDADGDALSYRLMSQPTKGSLRLDSSSGEFSYTPKTNLNGRDSFSFKVSDGRLESAVATVKISIKAVNDRPLLQRGINGLVLKQGESRRIRFVVRDADLDDEHSFTITESSLGKVEFDANQMSFTASQVGSETLQVRVSDTAGASNTLDLKITVNSAEIADANGDGLSDEQAQQQGLDPAAENADSDADGVPDAQELGDPEHPSDRDGDGIIDALEVGLEASQDSTSLAFRIPAPTAERLGLPALQGQAITIASSDGQRLIAHSSGETGLPILNEEQGVEDNRHRFPLGIFDFSVEAPNGSARVVFSFPEGVDLPADAVVRKLDTNNQWQDYPYATIDHASRTLTLELTDNDGWDRDPAVGVIRDPVGLAVAEEGTSTQATSSGGESGGGGSIGPLFGLLLLLLPGVQSRRRRG
ncbi:Ig-like domain-containing protein [endosymbiont of Ridgeia piscesae]|uniref:Ig-like domain-containing protein n=1 Tax=endosymbiont of Ridgeia piscesae TaxID=54398 RepID=UPI0018E06040|nr:Ig-like domain-containing protein [endosymbiont of Ridgeia piscesae]